MNDTAKNFGFGHFVPGFDFLQNLAKGASQSMPQMPGLSNWIAPTMSVEEVDKRISELRAVLFWLDQNQKALGATIQALEVQKMTLATLRTMNVTMSDLAESLQVKPTEAAAPRPQVRAEPQPETRPEAKPEAKPAEEEARQPATEPASGSAGASATPAVDPLQWWGALTQQFQQIAAQAMQQAAQVAPITGSVEAAPAKGKSTSQGKADASGAAAARRPAAKKAASARKKAPRAPG